MNEHQPTGGAGSLGGVRWPDAAIEGLRIDYDAVWLDVKESSGRGVELRCAGHIGFLIEGYWDETIIQSADVVTDHPFMRRNLESMRERLGAEPPTSGSPARNTGNYETLVVTLIDGVQILCTAAAFEVHVSRADPI